MIPSEVNDFFELYSGAWLYVYIAVSVFCGVIVFFASLKFLLALQQSGYKSKKYFDWVFNPYTPYLKRLMLLCLLGFLFSCVLDVCFAPIVGKAVSAFVGAIPFTLFTAVYIDSEKAINVKVPLKKTKRLVRLTVVYITVISAFTFALIMLLNFIAFVLKSPVIGLLRLALLCALPIISPFLLYVAHLITKPLEELIKRYYINKAKTKLSNSNVLKIGITGSFAKTSVKEILKTILSVKFRVLATPSSYNTPMGIALSVKNLDSTHDVFIAEMGARSKGDIKELSNIVKPTIGVLTGVNNQHLETFKTVENTMETKFELFDCLKEGSSGFFSSDNENAVKLYERFKGEKYLAGAENGDAFAYATDIVIDNKGTTFTLNIRGEQPIECNTVLLGKHSVSNICLASSVAYKIGLTPKEIATGINRIRTIDHRLELVPNNKGIVIIDDSYNSNESGVKAAMEVLDTFTGRKIVLTPGFIELGKMENVANLEFGKTLSKHADIVFVIGRQNAEMLINGLKEGGMDVDNIKFAKTLNKANVALNGILKEGDVVLFENDLPDNYN